MTNLPGLACLITIDYQTYAVPSELASAAMQLLPQMRRVERDSYGADASVRWTDEDRPLEVKFETIRVDAIKPSAKREAADKAEKELNALDAPQRQLESDG